jgi:predicted esterase
MEHVRARRSGVKGWLCLLSGLALATGGPAKTAAAETTAAEATNHSSAPADKREAAPTRAPIELAETPDLPGVLIFPARVSGPRPITVVLHGMCGEPSRTCSHFAEQVTATANLVCPRASERCAGGGVSWPQAGFAQAVEAAVARAKLALPEPADDEHGRTLIGYSLGAYRALDIAQSTPGKYPRVMLIGAKISLNQRRLAENGVRRVLLSAGGWDMMHDPMQREAQRALRTGIVARFLDLGPVGHTFTPSFAGYLPTALSWLSEG